MLRHSGWSRQSVQRACLALLAALVAFFLLTERTAHVLGAVPYVLLLACPLMHLFKHHGHGGHDRRRSSDDKPLRRWPQRHPGRSVGSPGSDARCAIRGRFLAAFGMT
jgi:hypothetical protein